LLSLLLLMKLEGSKEHGFGSEECKKGIKRAGIGGHQKLILGKKNHHPFLF